MSNTGRKIFDYHKAVIFTVLLLLITSGAKILLSKPIESGSGNYSTGAIAKMRGDFADKHFRYQEARGIGREEGVTRRDPSDIIKVGDTYYVWYTKVEHNTLPFEFQRLRISGYVGTIWYATSTDEGRTWKEQAMALGRGHEGEYDSFAVFTPNIVRFGDKYYLYYTGVRPTKEKKFYFDNNSVDDFTAIGLAVSDVPDGPFRRIARNPILTVSAASKDRKIRSPFDSYRVDDAALLVCDHDRDGDLDLWLYYKGRNIDDGRSGPAKTCMGLAIADTPEGEYVRVNEGRPILTGSHEVIIWPHRDGVAAYASKSTTLEYAADGVDYVP